MTLTFLTGGARSGKSALAVRRAERYDGPVVFVATAHAGDGEMADRIDRHRAERPAGWGTVEAPVDLAETIAEQPDDALLLIDCLSLWVANLGGRDEAEERVLARADAALEAITRRAAPVLVVTNEVGLGLVPMHPVGRAYRDTLGRVNARFSRAADEALLVVAGRTLRLDDAEETSDE